MISYTTSFVPNKIMIIGCGGTGSRLLPLLGQFLKTCAWILNPEITLIDDDVVEEKNLLRQNFITPDVGKPKAEVLAQRYARAFNVNIIPKVARVTAVPSYDVMAKNQVQEAEWSRIFRNYTNNAIIVLCVDSPEARRHILTRIMAAKLHQTGHNFLLLDSGNENDFGQITVSMGARAHVGSPYVNFLKDMPRSLPGDMALPAIPMDLSYFKDMRAETQLSCADLDQTMAINTQMAVTMFGIIQNLYYSKPMSFYRMNVSLQHGITPEYINPLFLQRCMAGEVMTSTDFGCAENINTPYVDLSAAINDCYKKVILPHKKIMEKVESDNKLAEAKKLAKEQEAIQRSAVKAAAQFYGWKIPDNLRGEGPASYLEAPVAKVETSEATTVKTGVAAKKALTKEEQEIEAFLAIKTDAPKAVKKIRSKLDEVRSAYGIDDDDL